VNHSVPSPEAHGYLKRLNLEQRAAVESIEGPLLILAGAGTGKTRVLTTRFAHLLLTGKARPHQILAVTFTNKAAREMKDRIETLVGHTVDGLWLGTFHAICVRMLRRHAALVGLSNQFTILDTDDQIRLIKQVMEPAGIDVKRWAPAAMLGVIQRWKDRALTPTSITPAEDTDFAQGKARDIYLAYQERLRSLDACDFGDLILHVYEILRLHPEVLKLYHHLFRYIMVDEYQDTNTTQYLWLRLLSQRPDEDANIACVGDDDQSIYSWRGAEIENILRFERDFPKAKIIRLEQNYRSTQEILSAASGLIAHNHDRLGKTLRPGTDDRRGEKVTILAAPDSDGEAHLITARIETLHHEGHDYAQMAILVRASFQTRAFEDRMLAKNIPYRIIGGIRFYERAEIRDALAYARLLARPGDDLAFERIANTPRRGIGATAMQKIHAAARAQHCPLMVAALAEDGPRLLTRKGQEALTALSDTLAQGREKLNGEGHVVALEAVLEEAGYLQMWRDDKSIEAPGKLDNIKELLRAMAEFPSLDAFLEHIALVMDADAVQGDDKVNVMTLHGAKGLEFDTVFLPGWEEGIFPSQRSLDEGGERSLEEERRLAYVGLTRARARAIICHAARRRIYANWQDSIPSRFVGEIPEEWRNEINPYGGLRVQETPFPRPASHWPILARRDRGKASMSPPMEEFEAGHRVFHQKYGYGIIMVVNGETLSVAFEKAGDKAVHASYVDLISS